MNALAVASKLDWSGWVRGVVGAAALGAGAVAAGFGAQMADPAHDISIFKVMGFTFIISGVVSLAKYLQTTPVPSAEQANPTPGATK